MANAARFALGICAVVGLAGCAGDPPGDLTGNTPIAADSFPPIGPTSSFVGQLVEADNGCLMLRMDSGVDSWLVWPEGSTRDENDPAVVHLGGGREVRPGDALEVTGQAIGFGDLPDGDNQDSMWGAAARYCVVADGPEPKIIRAGSMTQA
jgi:hypothetical protein